MQEWADTVNHQISSERDVESNFNLSKIQSQLFNIIELKLIYLV